MGYFMVGHDCNQLRGVDENLLFTLADFEVKMLFGIGFEISKTLTRMGNISPKSEKFGTFTNIFQWMTTIFNTISNAIKFSTSYHKSINLQ